MNQRIKDLFQSEIKAKIAYITAGDGGIEQSFDAAMALIAGGVNLLEIGIPFSDPVADGPVIQRASARAISAGTTIQDVLHLVKLIRQQSDIPIVLFSYLNPIFNAMDSDFFPHAKLAGVDGLLLVDCPFEESQSIRAACLQHHLDLIYVIAPSTPVERIQKINREASGFLYYACQKGTTGVRQGLPEDFAEKIAEIKQHSNVPVVVGFGVSTKEMARELLKSADGVVVGSLFVKALEEGLPLTFLTAITREIFDTTA